MLDMGFEPQIRKILARAPSARQTLFFTATWPRAVVRVATAILTNPIQVNIGDTDSLVANKDITQVVEVCGGFQKQTRLMEVLRNPPAQPLKAIVFCGTKRMCDQIGRSMGGMGAVIHGDKEQRERDWIINQFKTGRVPVLVATDVAARGLDIKDVNLVVNFDFPNQIEDYVHRIGRTGRAGAKGFSHSFIEPGEGTWHASSFPSSAKLARRWIANSRTWRRAAAAAAADAAGAEAAGAAVASAEADAAAAVTAAAVVTAAAAAVMAAAAEVATAAAAAVTAPTAAAGIPTAAAADTAARIEFAQRCPASSVKMGTGTPLRRRETTRSVPRRIHITRAYTFDRTDRERALDERRAILAREELFSARRIFSRRLRDASHRPCALAMAPGGIVDPLTGLRIDDDDGVDPPPSVSHRASSSKPRRRKGKDPRGDAPAVLFSTLTETRSGACSARVP